MVWLAFDEPLGLEVAQYLGGHHRVCSGVFCQLALGDRVVALAPGEGGEQDELHVGEVERA